jgi:arsenate reductase (glutaredoxin)
MKKDMFKIYHNPRCRKSRAGLQYLKDRGLDPEIVEYMKTPLSVKELNDILVRLNKKPADIIRTQEDLYRSELKGKKFTDEEWVRILVENPRLIMRPILVRGPKAVIGDPAEAIEALL